MRKRHVHFLAALGLALEPGLAVEARDTRQRGQAYCDALGKKYLRYVASSKSHPVRPEVAVSVALADCEEGDTAEAILVLERKLIDAKVELPRRF